MFASDQPRPPFGAALPFHAPQEAVEPPGAVDRRRHLVAGAVVAVGTLAATLWAALILPGARDVHRLDVVWTVPGAAGLLAVCALGVLANLVLVQRSRSDLALALGWCHLGVSLCAAALITWVAWWSGQPPELHDLIVEPGGVSLDDQLLGAAPTLVMALQLLFLAAGGGSWWRDRATAR